MFTYFDHYTDKFSTLRYKNLLLMTDMDTDGSHIKGLVINFIHYFWPSLLERNFISEFRTPLLKVKFGKTMKSFYNMQDYHAWRENTADSHKYSVKYYKGLGTNTTEEALEYFRMYDMHYRKYSFNSDYDNDAIALVFDNEKANERKKWILEKYNHTSTVYLNDEGHVPYSEFINKELIHFSHGDNLR